MKDRGKANLRGKLESLAEDMGATYFGIADLAPAEHSIVEQGGEFLTQFPRAISHGFVLADG
ncbi:MAG: epoxyqueuosine reductase, partial [Dehalococcoidia bacterium]|nr:epoxyqueuosine reductase [Dehalococcoidia bacterium]